ncbi:MAG: LuxR C-terminal-related transcriptional regulator, partial [Candidatus Eiseniibacteriota bacterium]
MKAKARRTARERGIRLVVADDQPIDRMGLVRLLESQSDFTIVGQATTATEAADRCKRYRADVLILSIRLPVQEGATAISAVRAASPSTRVIALAERGADHCIVLNPPHANHQGIPLAPVGCGIHTDCLQLAVAEGALGALRRDAEPEQLYQAVRAVAQGNAWYEPRTASAMVKRAQGEAARGGRSLSARELHVADLISGGRSNKEISQALGISEPTVKKHVGHILAKLGLQDRLQIGIYVVRNPLLLMDTPNHS